MPETSLKITPPVTPTMKWVGGKTQLLTKLKERFPTEYSGKYIDPFMGALAVPLYLNPKEAVLSDANEELIITHCEIRDNVESVIGCLKEHIDDKEYFLELRARNWKIMPRAEIAARMIYLNKTCFNGLYRVNKKGGFNSPYGKPSEKGRTIFHAEKLRVLSEALQGYEILHQDYKETLKTAKANDLVFLDPPYHGAYTGYTAKGFYDYDQVNLVGVFKRLVNLGCHVITTNSNSAFIHSLYSMYDIEVVDVRRNVNCKAEGRTGKEVIITHKKAANDDVF